VSECPLNQAAAAGNLERVRELLAAGHDVNACDSFERTALMSAIERKNEEVAKLLLRNGANPNGKDRLGDSILTQAVRLEMWSLTTAILDAGANPNPQGRKDCNPLTVASYSKGEQAKALVMRLLDAGAKPRNPAVLANAIKNYDPDLIRRLIDAKAALKSKDPFFSPLQRAIERGDPELVKLLLDAGADASDPPKDTGLLDVLFSKATDEALCECAELLVKAGAKVDHVDPAGRAPLHATAQCHRPVFARWLLAHGANPNPVHIVLGTPLDVAYQELSCLTRAVEFIESNATLSGEVVNEALRAAARQHVLISILERAGAHRRDKKATDNYVNPVLSIPPSERRGLCDKNLLKVDQVLIRAEMNAIANFLREDDGIEKVERNVLDRVGRIDHPGGAVLALVKLKGQNWVYLAGERIPTGDKSYKAWSMALMAPVIHAGQQSTAGVVHYSLFDHGELVERLETDGQWFQGSDVVDSEAEDGPEEMEGTEFTSSLRTTESIHWSQYDTEWEFLDSLLRDQDAYLTFLWAVFEDASKTFVISAYNKDEANADNIERVDLAFYRRD
jgi:ankyrin repeat protein